MRSKTAAGHQLRVRNEAREHGCREKAKAEADHPDQTPYAAVAAAVRDSMSIKLCNSKTSPRQ